VTTDKMLSEDERKSRNFIGPLQSRKWPQSYAVTRTELLTS